MAVPKIFRSSDVGAPVMLGGPGTLISLLDACLVDGYGSTFASGSIISDTVNLTALDTVTIGSITYIFKTSVIGEPLYTVKLDASNIAFTLGALSRAINGTAGSTEVSTGTPAHPDVWTSYPGGTSPVLLYARKGGTAGNVALAKVSTHLTVSGSTLTGGGGTNTKASAGWTKPFTGSPAFAQGVYKQPAGCGFYLQVDDNAPGVGLGAEARTFGFETMTAWNTGTGQFPTVAQNTGGAVLRKVIYSTRDAVRSWLLIADDRTFYLFIQTGDGGVLDYTGYAFGDFYSFNSIDPYKCFVIGKSGETTTFTGNHPFGQTTSPTNSTISGGGHWLSRNFSGIGGSTAFVKHMDYALGFNTNDLKGSLMFPNGSDGGLYLAPLRILDGSTPGTAISGNVNLRGKMRGLWHAPYQISSFADGDIFQGSGELAGRSFMVVKPIIASTYPNAAFVVIETTAWDVSA